MRGLRRVTPWLLSRMGRPLLSGPSFVWFSCSQNGLSRLSYFRPVSLVISAFALLLFEPKIATSASTTSAPSINTANNFIAKCDADNICKGLFDSDEIGLLCGGGLFFLLSRFLQARASSLSNTDAFSLRSSHDGFDSRRNFAIALSLPDVYLSKFVQPSTLQHLTMYRASH